MTERLYYDDSYLREFDGTVTALCRDGGTVRLTLDRSAFYPTSGGQNYDTGTLAGMPVVDVSVDKDGEVWHTVSVPEGEDPEALFAVGKKLHGIIDWERRLDHMQQHAGDHMIAGAIHELYGGTTIGLHLGRDFSTIDVEFPDGRGHLSEDPAENERRIAELEAIVNERIRRNVPIRCWFPTAEELETLPLRKKPTVTGHIRVVAIGDFEMVACGGTHPARSGELGLVKILDTQPARGKVRVSFLAGERALRNYQEMYTTVRRIGALLSTQPEKLPESVSSLLERLKEAEREAGRLKRENLFARIPDYRKDAVSAGGVRIVALKLECDAVLARDLASRLIEEEKSIALVSGSTPESSALVFARSSDVDVPMGKLLQEAAKAFGGRGGGKPDFAQGGGDPRIVDRALEILREKIQ